MPPSGPLTVLVPAIPRSGSCFWRVLPGPYLEGWCGGRGGRSRWPRRPVPGGAAVAGVPIGSSMTRPRNAAVLKPRREGVPQVAREVACPMADCCPGQVLGQLLCLGEGEGVAGASPCLSGRGLPEACMSACWRCAVSWWASAASARLRSGSRSRAGVRSGSWVGLVHGVALTGMGTVIQKPRWLSARQSVGVAAVQPRARRTGPSPPGAGLSGDLAWPTRSFAGLSVS
jgi:hypothetical protein